MLEDIAFETDLLDEHIRRARGERAIGHFRLEPFDRLIDGIHRGRLTILSAEPGMAKTTLFGQLVDEAAQDGFVCVVATLEIAAHQWVAKSLARISCGTMKVNDIADDDFSELVDSAAETYRQSIAPNLVILEKPLSIVELSATISKIQGMTNKPVVLFHDYLQILPSEADRPIADERLAVKAAVSGLRYIANAYDIPVFAISSVNRTSYHKAVPGLGSLGGASAIEYSADTVLHLAVDGASAAEREENMDLPIRPLVLTAMKNRYAPRRTSALYFDAEHALFTGRGR